MVAVYRGVHRRARPNDDGHLVSSNGLVALLPMAQVLIHGQVPDVMAYPGRQAGALEVPTPSISQDEVQLELSGSAYRTPWVNRF